MTGERVELILGGKNGDQIDIDYTSGLNCDLPVMIGVVSRAEPMAFAMFAASLDQVARIHATLGKILEIENAG